MSIVELPPIDSPGILLPGMTARQTSWFMYFTRQNWIMLIFDQAHGYVDVVIKDGVSAKEAGVIFWHLQELNMGWRWNHDIDLPNTQFAIRVSLIGQSGFDISL